MVGTLLISSFASAQDDPQIEAGVHGTSVVVIESKDGFILAGDSNGSIGCHTLPGQYQKVFSIGKRSGLVVAGLLGSSSEPGIYDSLSTKLLLYDEMVKNGRQPLAAEIPWIAVQAVRDEALLLDGDSLPPSPLAEFSVVSVSENGHHEWITIVLSPEIRTDAFGRKYVYAKITEVLEAPVFKVMALGSGARTVYRLLNADRPSRNEEYSQAAPMLRYYALKKSNQLADLTSEEGQALAALLIDASIKRAGPCDGIGGSVEMLKIRADGIDWVNKIESPVRLSSIYTMRIFDSPISGRLDGLECVRCTVPAKSILRFDGKATVRLAQTAFSGPCKLILGSASEELLPATAQRLKAQIGPWRDVVEELATGEKLTLSTAFRIGKPTEMRPDYSTLCNKELKEKVLAIVSQLRDRLKSYFEFEEQRLGDLVAVSQSREIEEQQVQWAESHLQSGDKLTDTMDDYRMKFSLPVRSIRIELAKRLNLPPGRGTQQSTATNTYQISEWVQEIEDRTKSLRDSGCPSDR
jgi:20S proteasome alpha/beta subunit